MFNKPQLDECVVLGTDEGKRSFPRADVLFALEWSAEAPGIGGWDVLIDDETRTRLVSVVPPGSDSPSFFIYSKGDSVVVAWLAPHGTGNAMEVGRFGDLRAAVLALCPLHPEQLAAINAAMEVLYPGALRSR